MKKEFIYTIKFGEQHVVNTSDVQIAIMLAFFFKKNLEDLGGTGFYDIYCADILIAQFLTGIHHERKRL